MGEHHRPFHITNGSVVTETHVIPDGVVAVVDGRLAYVGPRADRPDAVAGTDGRQLLLDQFDSFDASGGWVVPGLIDLHVHGGGGADVMDGTPEALWHIGRTHARHGTTGWLATTVSAAPIHIIQAARAAREAIDRQRPATQTGARILGLHLEGPFISKERLGAQNLKYCRPVDLDEIERIADVLGDAWKMITLAPELPGADRAIRVCKEKGVIASMGHTDATFAQAQHAFSLGIRHVTHLFHAMRPFHHRDPGAVGASLLAPEDVTGELIADGIHADPAALRLAWRSKGGESLCLVTDAIRAAAMPAGTYTLGALAVTVQDGAARLRDGRLAGSVLTMDRAVGHMVQAVGIPVAEAVRMASLTPATVLGLEREKGSLAPGKDADIVVLDPDFSAVATWIDGRRC